MVARRNIALTPAPTAASVNATSTAPMAAQTRQAMKLKIPNTSAELTRSFTYNATAAETTSRARSM